MRRNRLVLYILMISALVIACMRGGSISYTLLYITWGAPIISGLYLLYVYKCFKIDQMIAKTHFNKGDTFAYGYTMKNRGIVTCIGIRVKFFEDLTEFGKDISKEKHSLLPGQVYEERTTLRVKYRGEYNIGIDRVEVTDFLKLFKATYKYPKKETVWVMPVIPHYAALSINIEDHYESMRIKSMGQQTLYPDVELRKYINGDSIKAVNWKASAKAGELFARKYIDEANSEILLIADFSLTGLHAAERIASEDKIIEAVLGIADYLYRRSINVNAMFYDDGVRIVPIRSREGMDSFYASCAQTRFNAIIGVDELFASGAGNNCVQTILVTHKLTRNLTAQAEEYARRGCYTDIVYIGDDFSKDEIGETSDKVNITCISSEQEVGDVLERKA